MGKTSYYAELNEAFNRKDLFYKPWIGYKYKEGISIFNSDSPKKILVIGASRYCEYLVNNENQRCPNHDICIMHHDYDKLLQIASSCPFVNDLGKRNDTHEDFRLCDINSASILKAYNGTPPKAYKKFQQVMCEALNSETPEKIWISLAFTNYFQPIVLGEGNNRTKTPNYRKYQNLYEESRHIVEKEIELLEPDWIILWQSTPIKDAFVHLFPTAKVAGTITLLKGKAYQYYNISIGGKNIRLITSPHPTDVTSTDTFYRKVRSNTHMVGYFTPQSITESFRDDTNNDDQWEDFKSVLHELATL